MASTDWNVDSPDVVGYRKHPPDGAMTTAAARARTMWMSDPARQQPLMADTKEIEPVDTPTPKQGDSQANFFPHPALSLPAPTLEFSFRMSVTLNPRIPLGSTPTGDRAWISFTGGSWSGSFGSGIVLPGGQDIQIITPNLSSKLSTNYLLQTHDNPPAFIVAQTTGWRTGPLDVLQALADPVRADSVDPRSYKFRIFVDLETGDERYKDRVNCGMWVGSGMRRGLEVIYDAYRVS